MTRIVYACKFFRLEKSEPYIPYYGYCIPFVHLGIGSSPTVSDSWTVYLPEEENSLERVGKGIALLGVVPSYGQVNPETVSFSPPFETLLYEKKVWLVSQLSEDEKGELLSSIQKNMPILDALLDKGIVEKEDLLEDKLDRIIALLEKRAE